VTVDDEDAALVGRCLAGESRAWTLLVERHGPVVWAVARRSGLTSDDEADVFQNTWRVAVEELSRLREPAAFPGWIARIARHQTMRVRRSYGIARRSMPHVAREDVDERLPDAAVTEIEERRKVTIAVGRIGRKCADLLRVLYYEDPQPGYADIAQRLGMRIGSIGPTRARCLEKLEKELGSRAAS
jgi:RNA polymerase sigma factor (sigma-70 family)